MEDFKLDIMIGEGPAARSITIDLPPFWVGATTRSGLITRPLRERFGIPLQMNFYEHDELELIIKRLAALLEVTMVEESAIEIETLQRNSRA